MNEIKTYSLEYQKIKDADFRKLENHLIFVKCSESFLRSIDDNSVTASDFGLLLYGFIHKRNGLSFKIIGMGFIDDKKSVHYHNLSHKKDYLRKRELNNLDYVDSEDLANDFSYLEAEIGRFLKDEGYASNQVKRLRLMTILDPFRIEDYPDIVKVKYYDSNEYFKVHYLTYRREEIYGKAETNNLGIPSDTIIGFKIKRYYNYVHLQYDGHIVEDIKELD